ncbi:MAG: hypothetical protein ACK4E0_15130 [Chitinophagaceae bacterium]
MRAIFAILLLVLFNTFARACDCDEVRKPVKLLLETSNAVFTGVVLSIEPSKFKDSLTGRRFLEIGLKIDKVVVGDTVKSEITVFTEQSDCGLHLRQGKGYLVYAYIDARYNVLLIHQCFSPCPEISTALAKRDLKEIANLKPK